MVSVERRGEEREERREQLRDTVVCGGARHSAGGGRGDTHLEGEGQFSTNGYF